MLHKRISQSKIRKMLIKSMSRSMNLKEIILSKRLRLRKIRQSRRRERMTRKTISTFHR